MVTSLLFKFDSFALWYSINYGFVCIETLTLNPFKVQIKLNNEKLPYLPWNQIGEENSEKRKTTTKME